MYKIEIARVKLSDLISKSKFINTNRISIHLFPVMHLYSLHLSLIKLWCVLASSVLMLQKAYKKILSTKQTKQNYNNNVHTLTKSSE